MSKDAAVLEYRRWIPPIDTTLEDLEGWFRDIWDARDFFNAFIDVSKQKNYLLQDAIVTAAIIRYARSFSTGKRSRLSIERLSNLTTEERTLHAKLKAVRDKYAAHPVNMQETHGVYIGYQTDEFGKAFATVVSTGTASNIALSLKDVSNSVKLCSRWTAWLHEENLKESARLLEYAKRMTSEEILALPQGPVAPLDDPEKVRRR